MLTVGSGPLHVLGAGSRFPPPPWIRTVPPQWGTPLGAAPTPAGLCRISAIPPFFFFFFCTNPPNKAPPHLGSATPASLHPSFATGTSPPISPGTPTRGPPRPLGHPMSPGTPIPVSPCVPWDPHVPWDPIPCVTWVTRVPWDPNTGVTHVPWDPISGVTHVPRDPHVPWDPIPSVTHVPCVPHVPWGPIPGSPPLHPGPTGDTPPRASVSLRGLVVFFGEGVYEGLWWQPPHPWVPPRRVPAARPVPPAVVPLRRHRIRAGNRIRPKNTGVGWGV